MKKDITVALGDRSYGVLIDAGLLSQAGALIAERLGPTRAIIVTDDTVGPLYADKLQASLDAAGIGSTCLSVPAGEASKSWSCLGDLTERVLAQRIERRTPIIALGGGVVGDLAGFVAAIALRGVPLIQIPTTLLSQVDSSVGGKTGVNSAHGKNLIGAFYQPDLVLIDIDTLATLPRRELLAGYAEVVKYGLIDRPAFFDWLETNGRALLDGDPDRLIHAIGECVAAKAQIVAEDEREAGRRALLNLGHTFGHALELAAGYSDRLRHGEAVAVGMVLAFELSARLGLTSAKIAERVAAHLAGVGLPTRAPADLVSAEQMLDLMATDKKVRDGRVTFILARGIGAAFMVRDVDPVTVRTVIAESITL